MNKVKKHRPAMTAEGIGHIVALVKEDLRKVSFASLSANHLLEGMGGVEKQLEVDKEILHTLIPFLAKLEVAELKEEAPFLPGVKTRLISSSSESSLALSMDANKSGNTITGIEDSGKVSEKGVPKKVYWKLCYEKSIDPVLGQVCSKKELAAAQEHRYINNLMTEEEEQDFEIDKVEP